MNNLCNNEGVFIYIYIHIYKYDVTFAVWVRLCLLKESCFLSINAYVHGVYICIHTHFSFPYIVNYVTQNKIRHV